MGVCEKNLMLQAVVSFFAIFVVWIVWVIACAGASPSGSTSIFPGIPVFPVFFWGILCVLNAIKPNLGIYVIGTLHVVFLVALLVSIGKSLAVKKNLQ